MNREARENLMTNTKEIGDAFIQNINTKTKFELWKYTKTNDNSDSRVFKSSFIRGLCIIIFIELKR